MTERRPTGLAASPRTCAVAYAIRGGLAVAINGYPRYAKNIDFFIRAPDLERVRSAVARIGFDVEGGLLRFWQGTQRERAMFRVSKWDGRELLTLELLLAGPALDEAWRGRQRIEWQGRRLAVVSREGLEHTKRLAGRTQDLADIENLRTEPEDPTDG